MPKDKSLSHLRVLEAARQEFLEKGFEAASIRSIGKRAGMTSAGLYRHCRDKEDLFSQVVEPAISEMNRWLQEHAQKQLELLQNGTTEKQLELLQNGATEKKLEFPVNGAEKMTAAEMDMQFGENDVDLIRQVVYPNRKIFRMILCQSKGTQYEDFIHTFTIREQQELLGAIRVLRCMGYQTPEVYEDELHCLLSAYYTALFEPIIHDYGEERMEHILQVTEQFFMPGWKKILGL